MYRQSPFNFIGTEIASWIIESALFTPDGAHWPGFVVKRGVRYDMPDPAKTLYSGKPGILYALLLAANLDTSGSRYLEFSEKECASILYPLRRGESLSFYLGALGRAYVGLRLASATRNRHLEAMAKDLMSAIVREAECTLPKSYDLLNGSSGIILGLMLCSQYSNCDPLRAVCFQADHIAGSAVAATGGVGWIEDFEYLPITGLSHGATGIAMALVETSMTLQSDRYLELAMEALSYEDGVYTSTGGHWPDFRNQLPGPDRIFYEKALSNKALRTLCRIDTWCHGSLGIALGRIGLSRILQYPPKELKVPEAVAAASTKASLAIQDSRVDVSLCHGVAGYLAANALIRSTVGSEIISSEKTAWEDTFLRLVRAREANFPHADSSLFLGCGGLILAAAASTRGLGLEMILPLRAFSTASL